MAEKKPINWIEVLRNYVQNKPQRTAQEIDDETDQLFLKYIDDAKQKEEQDDNSYKKIPKFFQKALLNEHQLNFRVRQEARTRFLHHKTSEILDKEDLEKLWMLLKDNISPPNDGKERINYNSFLTIASMLPIKCRHFFSASTFLKFDRDEYGRIDIIAFFHSIVRKVNLFQTRIQISLYDTIGNGYLREKDLENYIFELIPIFAQLQNLQENFFPFYVITAVRKFFFFLDPKRTGRIYIKDMLTSPILAELYELRQDRFTVEELSQNWFSVQSTQKVYQKYLKLDTDHNGLLKKSELQKYSWGLTNIFIDRVFEECQTFEGEIDYKTFLDFVLAMENKKTPQSLQYFFKILDVYHKGAIDTFVLNMFFRPIVQKLEQKDKYGFNVEDVKDEIFDMAKPSVPHAITLQDLINCGQGDIIVSMLIDAKAFYDYDQRESGNYLDMEEYDYDF
ncbi:serine/threonine-protein phosphatase 2A regulatory subunit B subunit gamma (macronuclear) [Tetrahymena thermophila SB210]|uniref:Serine/threonine-protein phosphatase 2A regulatory subunit B subunit gamma n=1 Tax=Tetrahymena thermophila (strain SB210) TaxID=312017 RepID=Q23MC3_TETTS|nr:serine/threonine-protein phosphatase 2A regulatory subunit B subunit gamma [Tetrahymena thermophila SB210]EAR97716.2 serine/threonine-protein phosphatase 2A regulatory subunit B subunit gamma [Tetrahymena thermophila SB210]|eukprot:XP_001017961.2 serine/threonine-protein phosphatase 2A regulatory subunit B subunit gamma [Tetrahymena thermophila SB210]